MRWVNQGREGNGEKNKVLGVFKCKMINPIHSVSFIIAHSTTQHVDAPCTFQLSYREERLIGVLRLPRLGERVCPRRVRSSVGQGGTVPQLAVVSERIDTIVRIRNQVCEVGMLRVRSSRSFLWVHLRKIRGLGCR